MSLKKFVRLIAPLVLVAGMLLALSSGALALGVYNFTPYTIYVDYTPDQCSDWGWVPRGLCRDTITVSPNGHWSSNNRGGAVMLGMDYVPNFVIAKDNQSGRCYISNGSGLTSHEVHRQGWAEVRVQSKTSSTLTLKVQVFDQNGKRIGEYSGTGELEACPR